MPLQHENRDFHEVGNDQSKENYQRFEHSPLDVLQFTYRPTGSAIDAGTLYNESVRIYCPDVRVISRVAVIFQPSNPNDKSQYDLSTMMNTIDAYRAMTAMSRIARVGEIIGKNGVPFEFPKSDIDGIAFQNDDDMPWIDIDLSLAFPGVPGTWTVFYHATSNNKLKRLEWEGYISRVTLSVQSGSKTVIYGPGE